MTDTEADTERTGKGVEGQLTQPQSPVCPATDRALLSAMQKNVPKKIVKTALELELKRRWRGEVADNHARKRLSFIIALGLNYPLWPCGLGFVPSLSSPATIIERSLRPTSNQRWSRPWPAKAISNSCHSSDSRSHPGCLALWPLQPSAFPSHERMDWRSRSCW